MKKLILISMILGIVLTSLGLVKVSGIPPAMPPDQNGVFDTGFEASTPSPAAGVKGYRGFPLAVMYLQYDQDGNSLYEGYSIAGTVGDIAIYSLVVLGVSVAYKKIFTSPSKK